ncbi:MAG TPA: hypothetical protein VFV87_01965 [Pirellulaceae bacterium]|nr:hypothetical protein [Pirellulaceae bacterium]
MNASLWAMMLLLGQQPATSTPEPDNKVEAEQARAVAKLLAHEYEIQLDQASDEKLKLQPEPVFRWLLQLDRRFYSDVYLWTHEGRPEVVAAITNVYGQRRAMETEIHSLSAHQPIMSHQGQIVWQPDRPGLELEPLSGAAPPQASAAARLRQMRALAAEHAMTAVYDGTKKEDLRLLSTPVYRYASEKLGITDGALFAFVRGTDPEAFLMLEARQGEGGVEWHSAFARFCGHCSLAAKRDGREVWNADVLPAKVNTDPKQPYFGLRRYSDFPVVK